MGSSVSETMSYDCFAVIICSQSCMSIAHIFLSTNFVKSPNRDDAGRLLRTKVMRPQDITQQVKQKHHWEGGVCLAFADKVLCWLYGTVKEDENYTLYFNRNANRLELVKANSCPEVISSHMELLSHTPSQ